MAFDFAEQERREKTFKRLGFVPAWPNPGKSNLKTLFILVAEAGKDGMTAEKAHEGVTAQLVAGEKLELSSVQAGLARMTTAGIATKKGDRFIVSQNPTRATWEAFQSTAGTKKDVRKSVFEQLVKDGAITAVPARADQVNTLLAVIDGLRDAVKATGAKMPRAIKVTPAEPKPKKEKAAEEAKA